MRRGVAGPTSSRSRRRLVACRRHRDRHAVAPSSSLPLPTQTFFDGGLERDRSIDCTAAHRIPVGKKKKKNRCASLRPTSTPAPRRAANMVDCRTHRCTARAEIRPLRRRADVLPARRRGRRSYRGIDHGRAAPCRRPSAAKAELLIRPAGSTHVNAEAQYEQSFFILEPTVPRRAPARAAGN